MEYNEKLVFDDGCVKMYHFGARQYRIEYENTDIEIDKGHVCIVDSKKTCLDGAMDL